MDSRIQRHEVFQNSAFPEHIGFCLHQEPAGPYQVNINSSAKLGHPTEYPVFDSQTTSQKRPTPYPSPLLKISLSATIDEDLALLNVRKPQILMRLASLSKKQVSSIGAQKDGVMLFRKPKRFK